MALGIDDGFAIGVGASDLILNYNKKQYEDRITELEECVGLLDNHRNTLTSYRGQLKSIWNDDDTSEEYGRALDKEIRAVSNAQYQVKLQIESLKEVVSGMQDTKHQISEKIASGINAVLDALNIE